MVPDGPADAGCPIDPSPLGWVGSDAQHLVLRPSGLPLPEAFVLAGGGSTRMGRDKALLPIDGKPLIVLALEKLRSLGLNPRIAGTRPDLAVYAPIIEDLRPPCGPLGGIEAALAANAAELNLFIPVDLPLLPLVFLRWMLDRATHSGALATIPTLQGQPQPLCAVLRRGLLPRITRALDQGEFKVIDALTAAAGPALDLFAVEAVLPTQRDWPMEPPVHRWFRNLNTPADLDFFNIETIAPSPAS